MTARETGEGIAPGTAPEGDLHARLARKPGLPEGLCRSNFPTDRVDFRGAVARAVMASGMSDEPLPLETLHGRVRPQFYRAMPAMTGTPTMHTAPELQDAYLSLVQYLAREVLGFDVVFQDNPSLRFHFPLPMTDGFRAPDGRILSHHWDILSGDPIEQINCWLPLTRCGGSNTMQYAPWGLSQQVLLRFATGLDFDLKQLGQSRMRFFDYLCADPTLQAEVLSSCRPLEIDYGEVAMFDARLLHATEENSEATTRISLDFRLLSIPAWEKQVERFQQGQIAPCYPWQEPLKGRFYDARSAFEL